MRRVEALGVGGIPEVREGDDLATLIRDGVRESGRTLLEGDILVVSQKVVSKAEGRTVLAADLEASPFARLFASDTQKTPEHVALVLREATRIVRMDPDRGLLIAETPHGFVCANAGVDRSNVGEGEVYAKLPVDPDASARRIREGLERAFSVRLAVIISDSFGRPWRGGSTDVAIGLSGFHPLKDYRGLRDRHGYELRSTVVALADEVAAAADLVKGKLEEVPVAIVRGVDFRAGEGSVAELIRPKGEDLFR